MPYKTEWVPAELFLEYKGVRVVHTYSDNNINSCPYRHYYALDGWTEGFDFDIRLLGSFTKLNKNPPYMNKEENKTIENKKLWEEYFKNENNLHIEILKSAIDSGEIKTICKQSNEPYECD